MNTRPGIVYYVGRAILRPLLWLLFRPRVSGRADVPTQGPVLFVANHLSVWDTLLIPVTVVRPVQFLTKSEYFTGSGPIGRIQAWFFRSIGAVPVVRSAGRAAQASLEAGREILSGGGAFAIFPEGTRSRDSLLHEGKTGAAWLAIETGATVVPVGLVGTDSMRPFRHWGGGDRVTIRYGSPMVVDVPADAGAGAARKQLTERFMVQIAALSGQRRAETRN